VEGALQTQTVSRGYVRAHPGVVRMLPHWTPMRSVGQVAV
jgi:hypothetical protein